MSKDNTQINIVTITPEQEARVKQDTNYTETEIQRTLTEGNRIYLSNLIELHGLQPVLLELMMIHAKLGIVAAGNPDRRELINYHDDCHTLLLNTITSVPRRPEAANL